MGALLPTNLFDQVPNPTVVVGVNFALPIHFGVIEVGARNIPNQVARSVIADGDSDLVLALLVVPGAAASQAAMTVREFNQIAANAPRDPTALLRLRRADQSVGTGTACE